MTASDILEAQINRMTQEIDRQAKEITRYRVGIAVVLEEIKWVSVGATIRDLNALLDPGPAARGETPLLDVE